MSNALGSVHEKPLNQSRLGIVYVFSIFCISSFGDCSRLQHQGSTFFCRGGGGGGGGGGRTGRMMHCALLMANSRNFRLYQEQGVMVKRWTFNSPVAGVQIVKNSAKWRAEQKTN